MILYFGLFLAIFILYILSQTNPRSKWLLGIVLLSLGIFVGLGDMLGGYDRYIYGEIFDTISSDIRAGYGFNESIFVTINATEIGYTVFNVLMSYITQNRYIFIFTLTLIIYILLFFSIKKYTNNYSFAVLLFLGLWFFFTFTYLRQVTAAAIAWLAIEYAIDRKPWKFFGILLIAFSFHNSAIIFAPIYFIPIRKFSSQSVIGVMIIILLLGMTTLPETLFSSFGGLSGTEERMAGLALQDEKGVGFRPEYLLEAVAFLGFILMNYSLFDEKNKTQIVLLNMALVFCAILLFFIRSGNGGRLGWYYMIGVISILTLIATKDKKINIHTVSIAFMSLVLYIRIVISWGVLVSPYKSFLTNGHREGDYIYEQYEYDHRYDSDKFYR